MTEGREYNPTYRQKDVDTTLDEHDTRLSRLEKAALIALGYGIADGGEMLTEIAAFF